MERRERRKGRKAKRQEGREIGREGKWEHVRKDGEVSKAEDKRWK